jgi:hypothetical protein
LLDIVPGLLIPLARTGHLLAMKVLSRDDRHRPRAITANERGGRVRRAARDRILA